MTLLFLTILLTLQPALSQNPTPCDGVFSYQPKGIEDDRWYGEIHFTSPKNSVGILIHIKLDKPADILGNWLGHVTTCNNKLYTIQNPDYGLRVGQYFKLPFFVKYSLAKPIPSIKSIEFNGKTICPEHDSLNSNEIVQESNSESGETPVIPKETSSGKLELSSLDETPSVVNAVKCGVVAPKATSLISKGQETSPGQWPWHAALYHHKDLEIMYACGATLITDRHVLTAAHCVTDSGTKTIMTPNAVSISLGKYNLKTFEEDFQDKSVTKIFIHPKYNPWRLYNDIAILKLSSAAEITNFVLPCCLWDEEIPLERIIGKSGTVVGWGLNNAEVSHRLMQANMPVVSTSECIFSRAEYREFLNDNNYCAGSRNGTSACRGDSGGAMVFPREERNGETVWRVRGIVSLSLVPEAKESCESSNYNIFTDIAKFIPWIQQVITL